MLGDQRQRLRTLLRANELQPARPVFTITLGRDGTGTKLVRSFADAESEGGRLSPTNQNPDHYPRRCLTPPTARLMDEYHEAGYERTNKCTAECEGFVRSHHQAFERTACSPEPEA